MKLIPTNEVLETYPVYNIVIKDRVLFQVLKIRERYYQSIEAFKRSSV